MEAAAFHHYWLTVHGPLARQHQGCLRYVQTHRVDEGVPTSLTSPHDGVAELWFKDEESALRQNHAYAEFVAPDEENFIDLNDDAFRLLVEERILRDDAPSVPTGVKLVQGLRVAGEDSRLLLRAYLESPSELAVGSALRTQRHTVNFAVPAMYIPTDTSSADGHTWEPRRPFDAVRELWWESIESASSVAEELPDAWASALAPPIQGAQVSSFLGAEVVLS